MAQQYSEVEWIRSTQQRNPHLAEIAQQHGRMVEVAIMAGEYDRALNIVSMAFEAIKENCVTAESNISAVAGERIASILEEQVRIRTVADVCRRTAAELLAIRNIDYPSLRRIVAGLEKYGFELKK